MEQERLSSLALLHMEHYYVNRVLSEDVDKMIDAFRRANGRIEYFF